MAQKVRLDIEPPAHGWAIVRLTVPGFELAFTASCTPRDSIGDLARAPAGLASGERERVVAWNTEPVEYDFRFVQMSRRTRLEVHAFPDARRRWRRVEEPLAVAEADTAVFTRTLWRGLRRLQGAVPAEVYAHSWGHPFPAAAVERIGEELRGRPTRQSEEAEPETGSCNPPQDRSEALLSGAAGRWCYSALRRLRR